MKENSQIMISNENLSYESAIQEINFLQQLVNDYMILIPFACCTHQCIFHKQFYLVMLHSCNIIYAIAR